MNLELFRKLEFLSIDLIVGEGVRLLMLLLSNVAADLVLLRRLCGPLGLAVGDLKVLFHVSAVGSWSAPNIGLVISLSTGILSLIYLTNLLLQQ